MFNSLFLIAFAAVLLSTNGHSLPKLNLTAVAAAVTVTMSPPLFDCFCAGPHCGTSTSCKGRLCMIGLIDGRVLKSCTPGQRGVRLLVPSCYTDVAVWTELCLCVGDHCNSYAFFRNNFTKNRQSGATDLKQSLEELMRPIVLKLAADQQGAGKGNTNFGTLLVDSNLGSGALEARSTLPILLIAVPLVIGGMAVLVVVMNYYCKMC